MKMNNRYRLLKNLAVGKQLKIKKGRRLMRKLSILKATTLSNKNK